MVDSTAPVIVATDFAADARAATRYGARLARLLHRPLKVLNVVVAGQQLGPTRLSDDALRGSEAARRTLLSVTSSLRAANPGLRVTGEVDVGNPCDRLVWHSKQATLLVMGARGHDSYPYRWGSTCEQVAARASCPVLVARAEADSHHPFTHPIVAEAAVGAHPDPALTNAVRITTALARSVGVELVEVMEADGRRCDAGRLAQAADDNDAMMIVTAETRPDMNGSVTVRELIERTDRPVMIVHRHDDPAVMHAG